MKPPTATTDFLQNVVAALRDLKRELQCEYERAYPTLREVVHLVLDEEEGNAWALSAFPHLIFADLVELHIAKLSLTPVPKRKGCEKQTVSNDFAGLEPAFA